MKIWKNCFALCMTIVLILVLFLCIFEKTSERTFAKDMNINISGKQYEFTESSEYEVNDALPRENNITGTPYGTFSINGNIKSIARNKGIESYEILDGNVILNYNLNDIYKEADDTEWHNTDDKSRMVNGIELESKVLSGAIIVQTSLSGDYWVTDAVYTDICNYKTGYKSNLYTSKNIQQVNGCFYRIIVAYEISKENEVERSFTNWFGKKTEYKKLAEIYEFYLINNSENASIGTLPSDVPKKELGTKINTGKNNGYSGNETIVEKDPHYGWNLGTFFVNGYTRETMDTNGIPIFLKNVGNRVILWFNLKEDISCLHGNSDLSICEDKDGYDQYFEIEKTNFRRGALIIRYTDYEGKIHDPVIYTDYLAANARTGADTKVELFEEGDYEVALNYEIKNTKGWDSYSDYRIFFKFSIRNGNSMVYPFDIVTGDELSDKALTKNGFKLDMAKSRYLLINVKKEIIKSNGKTYYTDERFNRPAKDGESYSDEGIYTFTVKNLYSAAEPTTKIIYVGESPIFKALSSGYELAKVNELLSQGKEINFEGTVENKNIKSSFLQDNKEEKQEPEKKKTVVNAVSSDNKVTNNDESISDISKNDNSVMYSAVVIFATVVLVLFLIIKRIKKLRK